MTPRNALAELLTQHARLRDMIARCELCADELDAGRMQPVDALREVSRLRIALDAHNQYEEQLLRPILSDTDAFGDVRVDHMIEDHVSEHRAVRDALGSDITAELRATLDRLRSHLANEERFFLTSKVLRDDLVVVEGGG